MQTVPTERRPDYTLAVFRLLFQGVGCRRTEWNAKQSVEVSSVVPAPVSGLLPYLEFRL